MNKIEYIKNAVSELLGKNLRGHDDKHVFRVYKNAMKFCDEIPEADRELVAVAALCHDCDDYKLFGEESERLQTNTRRILAGSDFDNDFCEKCLDIIKHMGYSKRLKGIQPTCIEGKIVSDADMVDASGLICVTRAMECRADTPFFNPDCLPADNLSVESYRHDFSSPVIHHLFQKTLRLRNLALTEPGRKCLEAKHKTIVQFLDTYFDEVDAPQAWKDLLNKYR